jgi:predicted dehydrogenase
MKIFFYKIYKYFLIYGFSRTVIKAIGRKRIAFFRFLFYFPYLKRDRFVSLIGCGQFGFSSVSYYLVKANRNILLDCFDVDIFNRNSAAQFWGYDAVGDVTNLLENCSCQYVYIASNHASHAAYVMKALDYGKIVYVEKPVVVNYEQFNILFGRIKKQPDLRNQIYVGYNRPFSPAVLKLKSKTKGQMLPITLNCFVIGHFLDIDHWYNDPNEGTRICGNLGHWLDLSINLLGNRGKIAESYSITMNYSDLESVSENINVSIITDLKDLISITFTARSEPFEGVNESIQFQSGEIIAKIDDFRRMQIWNKDNKKSYFYYPKDVGHSTAINQPFNNLKRDFMEIEISTIIMLEITDMALKKEVYRIVKPMDVLENL